MRNPYLKFQNSSIHGFKVMLCIKKRDERTEGRTDGRTNNPEAICPSNFFEVGGIKMMATLKGTNLPLGEIFPVRIAPTEKEVNVSMSKIITIKMC